MAKRLALVFPGQGSQRAGMVAELLANWPRAVGDVLDEASEAIRVNLRALMGDGPQETLTQTAFAQPAILAHSVAVLRVLEQETGQPLGCVATPPPRFVLGHSLGEYSALVAAQSLDFADAVKLVHFRGQAMQTAVPQGVGAMAALMPVSSSDAEEVCSVATHETQCVCQVANYNSSKQVRVPGTIVISGDADAVDAAIGIAKTQKKVRRAVRLDVSAPFHCALMEPAAKRLEERLQELLPVLRSPTIPVVWNVEAAASTKTAEQICETLTQQVVQPVKWSQSVDFCVANGVDEFLEIGFGGVLTGLIKQHAPQANARSCGTAEQIRAYLAEQ